MKNTRRIKVILVFVMLLIILVVYIGCEKRPTEQKEEAAAVMQINPVPDGVSKNRTSTRLYFGYSSGSILERLLIGENRPIDLPVNEKAEPAIIEELIKPGPSPTKIDFVQLINPATTVVNVEAQGQYLFVTLSKEFVEPFGEEIDASDDERVAREKTRKYLAVYSIVNTLVEQGTYSRVSIKIDEGGTARSLTREEAGMDMEDPKEPFERNGEIELNGRNTMREILTAIEKKEWNTLYSFIANKNYFDQERPSLDEFTNEVIAAKLSISNSKVVDAVMSSDGLTDIIMVDYDLKLQDGEPRPMTNIPIRLTQENDVWKISYTVFKSKFMA